MALISLIGVLTELNLFSMLFLVLLPLPLGYIFRILEYSFQGYEQLPDFDKWKKMCRDGARVIIVILIYAIPLIILNLISNPDQIISLNYSGFSFYLLLNTIFFGSIIQIIVFIIIGLLEFIGLANMVLYGGEIRAAFRFRELIKRISMIGWIKYLITYTMVWLIGILLVLISFVALTILVGIIIIPLLIAPYFIIFSTRLLALIFSSSEA